MLDWNLTIVLFREGQIIKVDGAEMPRDSTFTRIFDNACVYIKKSQLLATGITLHQEWLSLKETITTMKNMMLDFIVDQNVYLCSGICFGILKYPSFVYLFVPS